jgi:endonuclease/exonuclease/phosphatase family metal-dependent hydrolase
MFTSDYEEVSRWDQLRTLTEHLNQTLNEGIPIILGGDLNTGPRYPLWCKWMTYMKDNFQDLFDSVSYIKGLPSTFNNDLGHRDQGQLDHIIAFGKAKVIESKVVLTEKHNMCFLTKCEKLFVSDHFGLQSILAIPRSQKCNL